MWLVDKMRSKIRSFLQIENNQSNNITLNNLTDYETDCYINRVWSWGDKAAIEQLFKQIQTQSDSIRLNFWVATPSMGIVKRHTGLPGIMLNTLTDIIISDMNDITIEPERQNDWNEMCKTMDVEEIISEAVRDVFVSGDGAFRVSIDENINKYPIVDFVPGENVEYKYVKGQIREIIFKEYVSHRGKRYQLQEVYGYGYIRTELYDDDNKVSLKTIPAYKSTAPEITFDNSVIMAVPLMFFKSLRYKGRGKSIFSGKTDSFDSLDEAWSQWMEALRKGRTKEYIPDMLIPRNPDTGEPIKPNDFDNSFIAIGDDRSEKGENKIQREQPAIPHESYLSTYITALDQCLQGVISPSTLGIDVKKLDNAEAQREKEKTTLYTRNKVVVALQKTLPVLVNTMLKAYDILTNQSIGDINVDVSFGEYANPSFESQVETVSKAKSGGIMSIEAAVDELYGASKEDEWKAEEVARIKEEQGIATIEEPYINTTAEDFKIGAVEI